jgi:hypothetical protein
MIPEGVIHLAFILDGARRHPCGELAAACGPLSGVLVLVAEDGYPRRG